MPEFLQVCKDSGEIDAILLDEFLDLVSRKPDALISIATGQTYASFLRRLASVSLPETLQFTHPDEFLGISPQHPGGMVAELLALCPHLHKAMEQGRFLAVPASGEGHQLADFERMIEDRGGIDLHLLGIGRNGHIAFNEPGTRFLAGYHRTPLAESTRADLAPSFAPQEPPDQAVTAGPRSILAAHRIILCAKGKAKADAIKLMMSGSVSEAVPASLLRRHDNARLLLDPEAASGLEGETEGMQ